MAYLIGNNDSFHGWDGSVALFKDGETTTQLIKYQGLHPCSCFNFGFSGIFDYEHLHSKCVDTKGDLIWLWRWRINHNVLAWHI